MEAKRKRTKRSIKKITTKKAVVTKSTAQRVKKSKKIFKKKKTTKTNKIKPVKKIKVTSLPTTPTKTQPVIATPVMPKALPEAVALPRDQVVANQKKLSYNRTGLWLVVSAVMILIMVVWIYALPKTIFVATTNKGTATAATSQNISKLMTDFKQSWSNLTQQWGELNTNVPTANLMANTNTNQAAVPSPEELEQLFADLN
ncbi:MAG: hypothetical protein WC801_04245 [Patescibacteria group bacterium]|jgi:hypothetical protein